MLSKSINLNFKLIKIQWVSIIVLLVVALIIFIFGYGSLFNTLIGVVALLVYVHINDMLFRESLFGDEAGSYMTIPFTAKETVWGKLMVYVLTTLIVLAVMVAVMISELYIYQNEMTKLRVMDFIVKWYANENISVIESTIIGALLPVTCGLISGGLGLSIMAFQLALQNNNQAQRRRAVGKITVFITMVVYLAVVAGTLYLMNLIAAAGIDFLALWIGSKIVLGVYAVGLYRFCVKRLTSGYDLA